MQMFLLDTRCLYFTAKSILIICAMEASGFYPEYWCKISKLYVMSQIMLWTHLLKSDFQ